MKLEIYRGFSKVREENKIITEMMELVFI